jgi:hypothetical protein
MKSSILRWVAIIVLCFFSWSFLGIFDIAYAIDRSLEQPSHKNYRSRGQSEAERFQKAIADIERTLEDPTTDSQTKVQKITPKRAEIEDLDIEIRKQFDDTEKKLREAGLPNEILERHHKFVKHYEDNLNELKANLKTIEQTKGLGLEIEIDKAKSHLQRVKPGKRHIPLDPNKLPHRTAEVKKKEPRLKKEDFERDFPKPRKAQRQNESILVASNGPFNGILAPDSEPTTPNYLQTGQGGNLPTAEDLAENIEVQFTLEIKAKAQELEYSPVKIYNWVHNNIEFVPTYGSIQGAHMTLLTKQGNAFDTASLLIALLRASNIPARYVHGTIELPIDKVMNWVGGFTDPNSALDFIASGGIPVTGITSGGKVASARLEHVWVEAYVPYGNYRGTMRDQTIKTWIPIDGSLKQYEFTAPSRLLTDVPFDFEELSVQLLLQADVNEQLGRITGLKEDLISAAIEQYSEQVGQYAKDNNLDTRKEALIGGKTILPQAVTVLSSSLPYKVIVKGNSASTLPQYFRLYVTLNGFTSDLDRALSIPSFSYRISLPALNSRRLGITYNPATEADAQTLQSFRDSGATELPIYLIHLKPVVTLDGEPVSTGPSVGMGNSQFIDVVLEEIGASEQIPYEIVAGDEIVLGITGNEVTFDVVQARFDAVSPNTAAENLHQVALHYWMECDFFNRLTASGLGIHAQRLLSAGLFSSPLSVTFFFGMPKGGYYQSRFMDVKRSLVAAVGEDLNRVISFHRLTGVQNSFLEGDVFDQLFGKGVSKGISAVRLIAEANSLGVPIYHVTSGNSSSVLPLLSVSEAVETDIINALNAGKTVLIPEREISRGEWSGVGYIIRDETTGAGAYLISGGLNGGGIWECLRQLVPVVVTILAVVALIYLAFLLTPIIAAALTPLIPKLVYAMVTLFVIYQATAPAYAAGGGVRKSNQANPCCEPPPPSYCTYHINHPHWPCTGDIYPMDHWHYYVWNQDAYCKNWRSGELSLNTPEMCGPPPVPCPPDP